MARDVQNRVQVIAMENTYTNLAHHVSPPRTLGLLALSLSLVACETAPAATGKSTLATSAPAEVLYTPEELMAVRAMSEELANPDSDVYSDNSAADNLAVNFDEQNRQRFAANDATRTVEFNPFGQQYIKYCDGDLYESPQCTMYRLQEFFGVPEVTDEVVAGLEDAYLRTVDETRKALNDYVARGHAPDNHLSLDEMKALRSEFEAAVVGHQGGYLGQENTLQTARMANFRGTDAQKKAHVIMMGMEQIQMHHAKADSRWAWRDVRNLGEFASLAGWVIPWHLLVLNPVLKVAAVGLAAAKHGMHMVFLGTKHVVTAAGRTVLRPVYATGKWLQQRGVLFKDILRGNVKIRIITNYAALQRAYSFPGAVFPWSLRFDKVASLSDEFLTLLKDGGRFNTFLDIVTYLEQRGLVATGLARVSRGTGTAIVQLNDEGYHLIVRAGKSLGKSVEVTKAAKHAGYGEWKLPALVDDVVTLEASGGGTIQVILAKADVPPTSLATMVPTSWAFKAETGFEKAFLRGLVHAGTRERAAVLSIPQRVKDLGGIGAVRPGDILVPLRTKWRPAFREAFKAVEDGGEGWSFHIPETAVNQIRNIMGSDTGKVIEALKKHTLPSVSRNVRSATGRPSGVDKSKWDMAKGVFDDHAMYLPDEGIYGGFHYNDAVKVVKEAPVCILHPGV